MPMIAQDANKRTAATAKSKQQLEIAKAIREKFANESEEDVAKFIRTAKHDPETQTIFLSK